MSSFFPGGQNGFIPSFEASGKLIVGYSRNPADFKLNQWVQIQPVEKGLGLYLNIIPDNAGRIVASGNEFVWPDGNDAPSGADNLQDFNWQKFSTIRYAPSFRIGNKFVQQCSWDVVAQHAAEAAQQEMTNRTLKAVNLVTNSANLPSGHSNTATVWSAAVSGGGGKFSAGSATAPYCRVGLNTAFVTIQKATLSRVKPSDCQILMNPNTAFGLGASAEITDYCKQSPFGLAALQAEKPVNEAYNLPNQLFGYRVTVEETSYVSTRKGATTVTNYAIPDGTIVMVSRVGALEVPYGSPTFSSVTCFELTNLQTEVKDDEDNKRVLGRVVDDFDMELTAGAATALITAAI